ncbi:MAG: hypothetical protein FD130_29 [Halothiobacillaceae bacterium]|nr:MAG: hypothetical protein FD130_29 [Halothiobacillaceae bacterium]
MTFRLRSLLTYSLEIVTASALALLFFGLLFWLLHLFFPRGPGLGLFLHGHFPSEKREERSDSSLWVATDTGVAGLNRQGGLVAELVQIVRDVRGKSADAIAWKPAVQGMPLYDRDSIQTLERSSATIKFDAHNQLELASNSLVIIKRLESDLLWPERRTFMVMVDGELRGKVSPTGNQPVFVEIATPNAVARVRSSSGGENVDFQIKVNRDKSSTVKVFKGSATVVGAGTTVNIGENQSTVVSGSGSPTQPALLPDNVLPVRPADNELYYFRELPPKIRFEWEKSSLASEYRLVLAKDAAFNDIVFDSRVTGSFFEHGNLKQGEYFWHVIGIGKNGSEGTPGVQRSVTVVQDVEPPRLQVKFPKVVQGQLQYPVQGVTERKARIFIDGQEVMPQATGEFSHEVTLKPGVNIIVVEAVDLAGNVSYQSETVHGKLH